MLTHFTSLSFWSFNALIIYSGHVTICTNHVIMHIFHEDIEFIYLIEKKMHW